MLSALSQLNADMLASDHAADALDARMLPVRTAIEAVEAVDDIQRHVTALQSEINDLRRRDEILNVYMHRLDEELRLAARLQQDFLPKELPQIGPVHFHSLFRPAGYVSGDLYDVMRLDELHVGFYMADAVGHGVPAALLTMFLKHALQTKELGQTPDGKRYRLLDPGESLRRLNNSLLDQNLSNTTFATALYGIINVQTLEMKLSRAGHPGAVVMRGIDGPVETLEPDGGLLGIFPDEVFATCSTTLNPGDRLFIYTDGVEVAFWEDQTADTNRWREELLARRHIDAESMLIEFAECIDREAGSLQAKDDLTMLLIDIAK